MIKVEAGTPFYDGFTLTATNNLTVVVEGTTDLAAPAWSSLQTLQLSADSCDFTDPFWTNYPARFYRLRWP